MNKQTLDRQGDSPRGKNRLSALSSNPEIESQPSRANISLGRAFRPAQLYRLSFEDCLDLGGTSRTVVERMGNVVLVSITGRRGNPWR